LFGLGTVGGCVANPINQSTFKRYYSAGIDARDRGDLSAAREYFRRARINAQLGRLGPQSEARATYQLGRIVGNLCEHSDAEFLFAETVKILKESNAADRIQYAAIVEAAQFNYDIGQNEKAVPYFEQAIAIAEKVSWETYNPTGYAEVLKDFANALRQLNRLTEASEVAAKARAIRDSNPGARSTPYVRYPKTCK
jgi:tetratricopeptide (TPR) repeat protein